MTTNSQIEFWIVRGVRELPCVQVKRCFAVAACCTHTRSNAHQHHPEIFYLGYRLLILSKTISKGHCYQRNSYFLLALSLVGIQ